MLWRYVIQGYKEQSPSAIYIKFQCNTHMKGKELWSISRLFLLSFPQSPANFQSTPRSQSEQDCTAPPDIPSLRHSPGLQPVL